MPGSMAGPKARSSAASSSASHATTIARDAFSACPVWPSVARIFACRPLEATQYGTRIAASSVGTPVTGCSRVAYAARLRSR